MEAELLAVLEDYKQAIQSDPSDRIPLHRFQSLCLELIKAKRVADARLLAENFRDHLWPLLEQSTFSLDYLKWLDWMINLQRNVEQVIKAHFSNESYEPPEKLGAKLKVLGAYSGYRYTVANLIIDYLESDVVIEKFTKSGVLARRILFKVVAKQWKCSGVTRRLADWFYRLKTTRYEKLLKELNDSGTSIEIIQGILETYPFQNPFPTLLQGLRRLDITIQLLSAAATKIKVEKLDRASATYFDPLRTNFDALMLDMSEFSRRSRAAAMPLIEHYYRTLGELNRIIPSRASISEALDKRR